MQVAKYNLDEIFSRTQMAKQGRGNWQSGVGGNGKVGGNGIQPANIRFTMYLME